MKTLFKKVVATILLCLLGTVMGFAASQLSRPKQTDAPRPAPMITLRNLEGRDVALTEWKGKLLLVNFWATWCAPCRSEMPLLINAQKQYGARGLQIIGPALDDADSVKKMAADLKLNYPVMADYNSADAAMLLLGNPEGGLPFSVLFDAQGRIVETMLGSLDAKELDALITAHLPQAH